MFPSQPTSRRSATLASLGLLVSSLFWGLHCGGKAVEIPGGGSGPDGGNNPPGCPAASSMPPADGTSCNWGGACTFEIDPCNTGSMVPLTCDCTNGAVSCPPVAFHCPNETCPAPAQVQDGASCVGYISCPTDHPACPGGNIPEACTCKAGHFACPVLPCPPPPVDCTLGASCLPSGSTCSTAVNGPCGQYQSFTCDATDHWGMEVNSCTEGAMCQMPGGPCGPAYCTCSQGTLGCSSQVCFDGGVADAGMAGD
jgi:hypothetical protein